jgi:Asp-tRNA(Asn)/Glu-tRNA(Gln) amidotransferase A subunit family amidase
MPRSPRLSGLALRSAARVVRSRFGAVTLPRLLRAELKINELAALPDDARAPLPLHNAPVQGRPPREGEDAKLDAPPAPWSGTSATYSDAFARGTLTPSEVTERALSLARQLASQTPTMAPLYLYADDVAREEAAASTARHRAGKARGPLDGVPCVIKEEMAIRGFPWGFGTHLYDGVKSPKDATVVARLRDAGAIIVGMTAMTEYGMTPTGLNPKRPMPRNPHAPECAAGGSSTGTGVSVATGLVPFGLGADGGGSIRIPAAMNGVFGIKPTWGRLSRESASGGSVAHLGPLATSTLDLARSLEVTSGLDAGDDETRLAPPLVPGQFTRAIGRGVRGMRIGIEDSEWRDADDEVARAGREALRALEREGAVLVPVKLLLARYAAAIGYVSISVESRAILSKEWRDHADELTPDLQVTFATLDTITAPELLDAQRLRGGLRREVAAIFRDVDLLALPTTRSTAPRVSDAEFASGMLDAQVIEGLCRYAFVGNLTGLPAGTAPVGRDQNLLPIGLQLIGDAWDEATVLAGLAHLERIGAARVERPKISVDVLGGKHP